MTDPRTDPSAYLREAEEALEAGGALHDARVVARPGHVEEPAPLDGAAKRMRGAWTVIVPPPVRSGYTPDFAPASYDSLRRALHGKP